MEDSAFVSILKTLDKEEFKRFQKFLKSPYFNNGEYIVNFFLHIKKFYPEFSGKNFEKEKIYAALYPGEKYNDVNMRRLISELNRLTEHFLEIDSFNSNEKERKTTLIKQMANRDLLKQQHKISTELRQKVESQGFRESNDYFLNYFTRDYLNSYYFTVDNHSGKINLAEALKYYTDYFISEILPKYIALLGISKYEQAEIESVDFLNSIFKEIKNNSEYNPSNKNYILIHIYYELYELMQDYFNTEKFSNVRKLILKNHDKITQEILFYFFNELQNYCWVRIYKGDIEFEKILFEFYKSFLKTGLFNKGHFPHIIFDNYVSAGLNVQNNDWSLTFIEKYKDRLKPDIKNNVIAYNLAGVYYAKKDFHKALEELAKVHYLEYSYKLRIKADTIKLFYELKQFDSALNALDSMRHFIKNDKKNSKSYNLVFTNFGKFTTELINLNEKNNFDGLALLKKKINECENLMHKPWLNDKIDEIVKR